MFFYGTSSYEDGKKTKCIYNTIPVEGFYKKKERGVRKHGHEPLC